MFEGFFNFVLETISGLGGWGCSLYQTLPYSLTLKFSVQLVYEQGDNRMDKLTYRTLMKKLFTDYCDLMNRSAAPNRVETKVVFDEQHDQYMLVNVGWAGRKRFRGTTVYLRWPSIRMVRTHSSITPSA